ncbi:MAG: DUF1467 family protein [Paracoccus sp. (in: a-proteobacteria)]|uniref:DUF1467 family protein n=1 Tax=Paracoccus sp. TaxID=267 RepID=UPI0026DEAA36|nr:DUF1467 family protein [Paracoccus sp. (in: a-proteobacteria)]MDO5613131.1 DUF1467 family protein [Paracoccus sp. (in: a-proteobacteria)]
MNLTGGIVLYTVLWFLALFVILPIGQRSQADTGQVVPGTPAGAPHDPRLGRKALIATGVAAVMWAVIAWLILGDVVTRADIIAFEAWLRG